MKKFYVNCNSPQRKFVWPGKMMKIFVLALVAACLSFSGRVMAQSQRVTLDLKSCSIIEFFRTLQEKTSLYFIYNIKDLQGLDKISVKADNEPVEEILRRIFAGRKLDFNFDNNTVVVQPRQMQNSRIKGRITDTHKNPLPGVTIMIKGTTLGAVTDMDGNYSMELPAVKDIRLLYSFIGMKKVTYNFPATEDVRHNVVMEEDQVELQDVVVIGYGSKAARNLTSSVSSVKAKDLEKYANGATTFDNMPGGAVKGVLVNQNSGEPGAKATLNIRGITSPLKSQNNNEPLYVVDGVPFFVERSLNMLNPLSTLSPNDIESIDVLKDAAATAIYGSRGANGVVIIKTKDGHRNEQMKISLGYTLSVGNQIKKFKPLNTTKFKNLQELIIKNTLGAINKAQITDDNIIYGQIYPAIDYMANTSYDNYGNMIFDGLKDEAFGEENTNWVDETNNKNALTHMYNLAIRGGGKLSNYSFSFNAIDQEGLFINDDMQRYNSRLSFDSDVSKRFKVGAALGYTMTKRHSGAAGEEMGITREWNVRPDVPVYDETGELYRIDGTPT